MDNANLPLVTIMIPTYNQEEYIGEAIESALAQDYQNLEVIVTDDCSTDNTESVAKRYSSHKRLKYIRNQHNLGRVGNYHNTAHNEAQGLWAVNLDGDDYYTSTTFISDAMSTIALMPHENIVAYCYRHTNLEHIKEIIPYRQIDENRIIVAGKDYFLNYYRIGRFGHPNTLFRRDIGVGIGLYTLPHQACDFHSLIRIFLLGNIILDKRKIAYWRVHGTNTTIKEADNKQQQAMLTFDAIENFAKNYINPAELAIWRQKMNKSSYLDYIRTYVYANRNLKAAKLLLQNPHLKYWYLRCWAKLILGK